MGQALYFQKGMSRDAVERTASYRAYHEPPPFFLMAAVFQWGLDACLHLPCACMLSPLHERFLELSLFPHFMSLGIIIVQWSSIMIF